MEMMLRSLCPTTTPVYTSSLHRLLSLYYSLSFFSLSHHLLLHASSSPSLNNVNDAQLLLQFKASIPNPSLLHNWEPSSNPCSFTGVSCNNNNNHSSPRVTSVDLSFVPLFADFGSVFSNLMSLELLQSLSMGSTNLNGTLSSVPVSSRCGAFFADLDLSNNTLSGSISGLSILGSSCSSLKSLNLSMNSLDGNEISPDSAHVGLGWLKNLETLDLSFNRISGPNVVGWLFRGENCGELKHMSLSGNKVAGTLPVSHCAKLEHLDLSANDFVGEIVGGELAALTELGFLNLSANHFSGEIPALPTGGVLKLLNLSGNDFQGGLSEKLVAGLCPGLVELDLSYNKLSGVIPDGFGSCSYLESLNLSNNSFSGKLPVEVLLKMSSLKKVVLAYNSFGGQLPDSVSMLTELESLDLSSNNFSGQIPLGLCSNPTAGAATTSLKELYLQNNMLSGPIPATMSNCSQLVSLDLSFNFLTGTIPRSLGSLSNLRDLIMWLNHLTGVIPEELKNLKMLERLILDFNELGGSIPSGLSNCTNLNWISLSNNRLTGEIPPWIGLLSDLAILKLSNNSFYGRIPPELGDCRSLIWLDLNTNSLSGSIPPSLFKQSGKIADELSTRKRYAYIKNDGSNKACHGAGNLLGFAGIRQDQMTLTRISAKSPCNFTRVYGGITRSTFNNNGSMIFLDISYNMLSGTIPKEMGVMYYIAVLHLSHNNLSGPIPPELGDLKNLNILDLSHNSLEGTIPRSLARLSLLGELDLSNNRLWGSIPESSQFETFSNYSFLNNSGLCGYPLPSCSEISGSNASAGHNKSRGQASLAGTVAMGLLFSLLCIFGLIIALVEIRKRRQKKEASNSTLDVYIDSHPTTANASAWKLTGAREALSINLAAFEKPLQKLTFADLLEATNGFHNDALIGSGGFGDVYKARLKDGSTVAIKKLIHVSGQGDREFTAEMETIGKIKHRNLVPLLGYCKVGEERLLVYEYMRFGSLEDVLHDRKKTGVKLNWGARRKIAIGAARGLAFLHHNCIPHIIHRDMKCSNVLLDDNLEARVSDFGMARMMSVMDTHLSVSTLAGTPGYVPPEYYQSFRCSTKGDVYSYGVVLLELLTGRPPTDSADFGDNNLVGWVKQHAKLRLRDVFDPELMKEEPSLEVELLQHLHVASACLDERPLRRPTMIEVMAMFKKIQAGESGVDSSSTIATVEDDAGFEGVEMSIREGHELSGQ